MTASITRRTIRYRDPAAVCWGPVADVMQQTALEALHKELDTMVPRAQQVIRQAKQRVFGGDTHVIEKLAGSFDLSPKSSAANESFLRRKVTSACRSPALFPLSALHQKDRQGEVP